MNFNTGVRKGTASGGFTGGFGDWLPTPDEQTPAELPHDDIDDIDAAGQVARPVLWSVPPPAARPGRARRWLGLPKAGLVAGAVGVGVVVACLAAGLVLLHSGDDVAAPTTTRMRAATPATPGTGGCSESGQAVTGDDTGPADSGPEAIRALERGYYVTRDAAAVLSVMTPTAPVGPQAQIQGGIDAVPPGTTSCVAIDAAGPDRWAVVITENRPDGSRVQHHQTISTTVLDGRAVVSRVDGD